MQHQGKSEGGSGEGGFEPVKSLLSRWREKVFVLLVQQKLQQIQESREKMEVRSKVKLAHLLSYSAVWSAFDLLATLIKKSIFYFGHNL